MNRTVFKIIILCSFLVGGLNLRPQCAEDEKIILLTDRSSCVSGDTVWFKTTLVTSEGKGFSKIIHVQLDRINNQHISKTIIESDSIFGSGYFVIPDSLPTGTYSLKAFTNIQKNFANAKIAERLLVVYNRFDENIEKINLPKTESIIHSITSPDIFNIKTNKTQFEPRENITLEFEVPDSIKEHLADLVISAELYNPLAEHQNSINLYKNNKRNTTERIIPENNGIAITGRVFDAATLFPVAGATILLSISDSIPYFDFYFTDVDGWFYFFLKEIKGNADLVLQAILNNNRQVKIELFENFINPQEVLEVVTQTLMIEQKEVAKKLIDANRFSKHFYPASLNQSRLFFKPSKFKYPFYGKPTTTVYPRDFIDLPNFKEISRELLQGSKYREKKDTTYIKILNNDSRIFFQGEPLKLLDGIPIFDIKLFSEKNSGDINRIDIVTEERYFGDMIFKGVIAVYSPTTDLSWVNQESNLFRFDFQTVQIPLNSEESYKPKNTESNMPDFRQVLFWHRIKNPDIPQTFTFRASDIKGDVLIKITAVTMDGRILNETSEIEIK